MIFSNALNRIGSSFSRTGDFLIQGSGMGMIGTAATMCAGFGGGSPETVIGAFYISTAIGGASLGLGGLGYGCRFLGGKLVAKALKVNHAALPVITKK